MVFIHFMNELNLNKFFYTKMSSYNGKYTNRPGK